MLSSPPVSRSAGHMPSHHISADEEQNKSKSTKESVPDMERNASSNSKYRNVKNYKSSRFLQDLEAELELPPMTPVSDEKEEAVRALSRSIKQYMRTGSNGSYTSSGPDRQSRSATAEELERNSRMSVLSPAMSDYLPELVSTNSTNSSCVSPVQTPYRRPLSQLLIYDGPSYDTPSPSQARISRERSKTPSPEVKNSDSSAQTLFSSGFGFSQNSPLNKSIYSEGKAGAGASLTQESPINKVDISSCEASPAEQSRLFDQLRLRKETTKVANRDSLLCPYTESDTPRSDQHDWAGPSGWSLSSSCRSQQSIMRECE